MISAIHKRYHIAFSVLNSSCSSLLALQLCVGLCLLHGGHPVGFVTVQFFRDRIASPTTLLRPSPILGPVWHG
jgi:hypothetical protein